MAAKNAAAVPVSTTPMPTLASDAFIVDDDGKGLLDSRYGAVRQPRSEAAARKAGFMRLAALSAAVAMGGDAEDVGEGDAVSPRMPHQSAPFKSVNPHQRTALEQAMIDRIPERQKGNLTKTQSVAGKVYDGPGFRSDPAVVTFNDFVVGTPMTATVTLTNVSNGFNVFKVTKIPSAIIDCIDVKYAPCGLMSAGLSAKLTITFMPKEDADIDDAIPLMAQTGALEIPIRCRRRRTVIELSTKVIDFNSVVVAESCQRKLVIRNSGALPTKVTLRGDALIEALRTVHLPPPTPANGGQPKPVPMLSINPGDKAFAGIFVPAFGSVSLSFTFSPYQLCNLDLSGFLAFDSDDVPDQAFFVRGAAVDVPVFIDKNQIFSLGCCCDGVLYRDKFTVKNTTTASVQVRPEVPPLLRGLIEFVPPFGFAQPGPDGLDFQLRFIPNAELLAKNRDRVAANERARLERAAMKSDDDHSVDPSPVPPAAITTPPVTSPTPTNGAATEADSTSHMSPSEVRGDADDAAATADAAPPSNIQTICTDTELQVPVRVRVLGQSMPLFLTLKADLSPRRLIIEPNALHFPALVPTEGITRTITIFNDTRLFRYVGFVRVPANVHIHPRTARVRLAPGERYNVDLSVHPPEATAAGIAAAESFRQQLQLLTEHGESFFVTLTGTVRQPPLSFSAARVVMPQCALNDSVTATVNLVNNTNTLQRFSFGALMKRYGIKVSPPSGDIAAGATVTVVVTFDAHPAIALPVALPRADSEDDENAGSPADGKTTPSAVSPPPAPGGKAPPAPAAKKKTKAEEEAERIAKAEAEAAKAARAAQRVAQREKAMAELASLVPWDCSRAEPSAEQRAANEAAIMAQLRADAETSVGSLPPPVDASATTILPSAAPQRDGDDSASLTFLKEPWSRHRVVRLPCYIADWAGKAIFLAVQVSVVEPVVIAADKPVLPPAPTKLDKSESTGSVIGDRMVQLCGVPPAQLSAQLSGPGAPFAAGAVVRFGAVPGMATATRTLHLHMVAPFARNGGQPLRISVAPLDPYGPFAVIKPPTVLSEVGQRCEMVLTFRPLQKAKYSQRLLVSVGDAHRIVVTCLGEGLPTSLTVSMQEATSVPAKGGASAKAPAGAAAAKAPAAAPGGKGAPAVGAQAPSSTTAVVIPGTERSAGDGVPTVDGDLGHCLVGESCEAPILFENNSQFPLHVNVTFDPNSINPRNPNGTAPFAINPSVFTLQANTKLEGTVLFTPACVAPFTATAFVSYGGTESTKRLCLSGFAWAKGAYVQFPVQSSAPPGLLVGTPTPMESPVPGTANAASSSASSAPSGGRRVDDESLLMLPRYDCTALIPDPFAPAPGLSAAAPIEIRFVTTASDNDSAAAAAPVAPPPPTGKGADAAGPAVGGLVTRTVTVGTIAGSTAAEVNVEGLTDADIRSGWKIEAPKLAVPPGQRVAVNITFAPTAVVLDTLPLRRVAVVSTANLRISVKGGQPASDATYFVRLLGSVKRT